MRNWILCDSACDFTTREQLGSAFRRIPMTVTIDGRPRPDDGTFLPGTLRQALLQAQEIAITPPQTEQFAAALEGDWESCFLVTASGMLCGSYGAAFEAATALRSRQPAAQVHVFNSRSFSAGELLVARKIRELKRSGNSYSEVVEQVERFIPSMCTYLLPGHNGRLTLGEEERRTLLPFGQAVLQSTVSGGFVHCMQAPTRRQALRRLRDRMLHYPTKNRLCVISHAGVPELAEALRVLLEESCGFREILIVPAGVTATAMLHPGGLCVAF